MSSTNNKMLQTVANGLGELKDKMVFIGGAVAELYADNPAASDIRQTYDVDCVVELHTKSDYSKLEEDLRKRIFTHDTTESAPICRWIYKNVRVDVMPSDSEILGFSNRWYDEGIENKIVKALPDGAEIYVLPPAYYLAAKYEAHKSRGGADLRQSHDFEDIIYILENCSEIIDNINESNDSLKTYFKNEFRRLLKNENIIEGIESALPYGSDSDSTESILELIQNIAEINEK